jgi:hypothetical protein
MGGCYLALQSPKPKAQSPKPKAQSPKPKAQSPMSASPFIDVVCGVLKGAIYIPEDLDYLLLTAKLIG